MPQNFWEVAPVIRHGSDGAFWQSAPLVTQDAAALVDRKTGAPANVRAAVGAASSSDDRLATLRSFYPDARPEGDDNFVFNDPRHGGRPTLYNEENRRILGVPIPSVGDIVSVGPEISEAIGGAGGVAAAGLTAVPTGGSSLLTTPAAAGLGAAAGREAYGLLAQKMLGTQDARSLPQHLTDTAITAGVNAIGQRLGEVAGKGIDAVAGAVNRFTRPGAAQTGQAALTDFANVGVSPPTAGSVTGNRSTQIVENALSNTPGGARIMQEAADRSNAEVRGAAEDIAQRLASGDGANPAGAVRTPQGAGETLRNGAREAGERFADHRQMIDDAVEQMIGADKRFPVENVRRARAQLQAQLAQVPESRRPILGSAINRADAILADAAERTDQAGNVIREAGIPFGDLRKIRTDLGRELERPDVSGYNPAQAASVGSLYDALRSDILEAADSVSGVLPSSGGRSATRILGPVSIGGRTYEMTPGQALRTHDRYVRMNRSINLPVLQKVADQQTDEQAFKYAMSLSKEGGSRLAALRRNTRPEEWDVVASSTFARLGRAKPGAQGATELGQEGGDFSINTFLTNWNDLAPEARRALFQGTRYSKIVPEMETLGRVVERMKDSEKMANPSGTARNLLAAAGIGAAMNEGVVNGNPRGAALGLAAGLIAPRVAAQALTNPRVIRWLAQGARVSMSDPNAVTAHLARLSAIAEAEPEIREWASELADSLSSATSANASSTSGTGAGR